MYLDDTSRIVSIPENPKRIVSLCPSVTETLFALGRGGLVAGRTRYCVHPGGEVESIPVIGGVRDIDAGALLSLQPELVIAVKEENPREMVEALQKQVSVYTFDIRSFGDSLKLILRLGSMLDARERAREMVDRIEEHYAVLPDLSCTLSYLYLVWKDPWIAAGRDTYVDSVLSCTGFRNCMPQESPHYPVLTDEELMRTNAELVILPSEPYPFSPEHRQEIRRLLPRSMVVFADGEMLSWYGARMLKAGHYLKRWINELCTILSA